MEMNIFKNKKSSKSRDKEPAFGIDLGTTNSCIAILGNSSPEIIPIQGHNTMPSCVMWKGGDNFVVGREAYEQRGSANVIYSIKRLMGSGQKILLTYEGESREFEPYEISAEILKGLVNYAKSGLYKNINDVVITVPAYFSDLQMKETLKAGEEAGLTVLNLMKEPTAAALSYNRMQADEFTSKKILMYDLGGGTFDVSLVKISKEEVVEDDIYGFDTDNLNTTFFQVLGVRGDMLLGGDDVDKKLTDLVIQRAKDKGELTRELTKEEYEKLLLHLEELKKLGSNTTNFMFGKDNIKMTVTETDFVEAFSGVYAKTKTLVKELLDMLGMSESVDQIITVGGSTKSNVIRKFLEEDFNEVHVNTGLEPDLSIVYGASIQAKRSKFSDDTINVLDCIAMNIGILSDGQVSTLLPASSPIPSTKEHTFYTTDSEQELVIIKVYQGLSRIPSECNLLGELHIDNIETMEGMHSSISVRLSINSNGILELQVLVPGKEPQAVELVNVLGAGKNNLFNKNPKSNSKVDRWKLLANKMDKDMKEEFLDILERFIDGDLEEGDVTSFIKNNFQLKKPVVSKIEQAEIVGDSVE